MINVTLEQFLSTLLYAPVEAHILHLRTHGYSKHMALDEFYKESPEKADAIAEQTFGHVDLIQKYENVLWNYNYENAIDYLGALRVFIVQSRSVIYNQELHSNIWSAIDDYLALIDSTVYKLQKLYEGLDESTFESTEAQKQFIAGKLTYNGKNVKRFFDDKAAEISNAIETKLNRDYRVVSRNYVAVFYSKATKLFVVVYEAYNKGYYACAALPMIDFYNPEILSGTKLFKASSAEELISEIQKFGGTYVPIFISK